MSYVAETLSNLIHQTAFFNLTWGNYLMIAGGVRILISWQSKKALSHFLLVPIAFGMLLVNIYPDIMCKPGRYVQWCRWTSALLLPAG